MKDGWSAYKERNTNGECHWGLQVTLDPFFKVSDQVSEKNRDMRIALNGTANLPNVDSE